VLPVSLDCPFLVGYSVFSGIYLKLEVHLVIQTQFVFNQVYLKKFYSYMLNIVRQWSPPYISHQYTIKSRNFGDMLQCVILIMSIKNNSA